MRNRRAVQRLFYLMLGSIAVGCSSRLASPPAPISAPAAAVEPPSREGTRRVVPPCEKVGLAAYLQERLGADFQPRSAWAGPASEFQPVMGGMRVWKTLGRVRGITVHHAGGVPQLPPAQMIQRIFSGHTPLDGHLHGSADVAYHFFVDDLGRVWEGRDASMLGAHVGSTPPGLNNEGNIGVCGLGTFNTHAPTKAMEDGVLRLCGLISDYYGRGLEVRGHKDWTGTHEFRGTDCPGQLESAVVRAQMAMVARYGWPNPPMPFQPQMMASAPMEPLIVENGGGVQPRIVPAKTRELSASDLQGGGAGSGAGAGAKPKDSGSEKSSAKAKSNSEGKPEGKSAGKSEKKKSNSGKQKS